MNQYIIRMHTHAMLVCFLPFCPVGFLVNDMKTYRRGCGVPREVVFSPFVVFGMLFGRDRSVTVPACGSDRGRRLSVQEGRIESKRRTACLHQVGADFPEFTEAERESIATARVVQEVLG